MPRWNRLKIAYIPEKVLTILNSSSEFEGNAKPEGQVIDVEVSTPGIAGEYSICLKF